MERKQKLLAKKITTPGKPMEVKDFTSADFLTIHIEGARVIVAETRKAAERVVGGIRGPRAAAFHPITKQWPESTVLSLGDEQMLGDASKSFSAAHTNLNSANECIEAFLQQGR